MTNEDTIISIIDFKSMIDEETIISIIKGRFEEIYDMSIREFLDTSRYLFEHTPDVFNKFDTVARWKDLTKEQKTVRLIKGGFEIQFGMPFNYFLSRYSRLIEESPEKLI